jgi:hypothetical protein
MEKTAKLENLVKLRTAGGPPSFDEAKNRRQKARAAGMNPDYWYAVEWDANVKKGEVKEVVFWKNSIALFRGEDGKLSAIDNRCAHRQLKLSIGHVNGCNLVCPYHGWQYDASGRCVHIPHETFGVKDPEFKVRSYPVMVKYGLIFIFPGDPKLASERRPPEIPELEGPKAQQWGMIPVDATWKCHHSMILDNVSDFTHAYLHRRFKPFHDAKLTRLEAKGDTIEVEYDTVVGGGGITQYFVNRTHSKANHIKLAYEYPYQRSNTDDRIKHWCFVLPIDEQTTRAIFIFYFRHDLVQLPGMPWFKLPPFLIHNVIMPFAKRFQVAPLIAEDKMAVEAEQEGYNRHYEQPIAELNPAVHQFQQLTIRKWEEHLAKARS